MENKVYKKKKYWSIFNSFSLYEYLSYHVTDYQLHRTADNVVGRNDAHINDSRGFAMDWNKTGMTRWLCDPPEVRRAWKLPTYAVPCVYMTPTDSGLRASSKR